VLYGKMRGAAIEWLNEAETALEYGAVLARVLRKYEARFPN
jgi:hypothetical protein